MVRLKGKEHGDTVAKPCDDGVTCANGTPESKVAPQMSQGRAVIKPRIAFVKFFTHFAQTPEGPLQGHAAECVRDADAFHAEELLNEGNPSVRRRLVRSAWAEVS
jgi:hypothetical protein